MFLGLPDQYADPLDRGTDPRIRIRTKISRIHNTGKKLRIFLRAWNLEALTQFLNSL
jgi:hypothetical protein